MTELGNNLSSFWINHQKQMNYILQTKLKGYQKRNNLSKMMVLDRVGLEELLVSLKEMLNHFLATHFLADVLLVCPPPFTKIQLREASYGTPHPS